MLKSKEYVYAVYQEKSFSKAAQKLFVSQPALSAGIKKIEEQINAPIFDRGTNPVSLTSAGKYYIKSIEKIMEIERTMCEYFHPEKTQKTNLTIGSSAFFCAHVLPTAIEGFKKKYPNYIIELVETDALSLSSGLNEETLHLILEVEELDQKKYVTRRIKQEHLLLAVPKEYEINDKLQEERLTFCDVQIGRYLEAGCKGVDIENFSEEPFIFLKKGNDAYERCKKICEIGGFSPKITMYIDQLLTAYYITCSGKGVSFIRAGLTGYVEPTDKVYFYKINDALVTRNIYLTYKRTERPHQGAVDFFNYLTAEKRIEKYLVNFF